MQGIERISMYSIFGLGDRWNHQEFWMPPGRTVCVAISMYQAVIASARLRQETRVDTPVYRPVSGFGKTVIILMAHDADQVRVVTSYSQG